MGTKLKRKRHGTCIFCGAEGKVTDEHIFPESWYPDDTPGALWLWQAPACYSCNHDYYGKKEARIFPFLAVTADPNHPGAKGIAERGFRAADENAGEKPKDKEARARVRELMRSRMEILRPDEVPEGADHLGWRHENDTLLAMSVDMNDILPGIGKIARGVIYMDCGSRIDERYSVKVFRELSAVPEVFRDLTANVTYGCGRGIVVDMVRIEGHYPPMAFMQIRIWGDTHVWYAAIIPKPEHRDDILKAPSAESGE